MIACCFPSLPGKAIKLLFISLFLSLPSLVSVFLFGIGAERQDFGSIISAEASDCKIDRDDD